MTGLATVLDMVERLERMTVNAAAPDGNVIARLRGEHRVTFDFRNPDAFGGYDASMLEHQVVMSLRGVRHGRRHAVRAAVAQAGEELADHDAPHWDAAHRRYRAAAAELAALGRSRRGWVRITAIAMNVESVRIDPQALSKLDAAGFLAELHSAYQGLVDSYLMQRSALKRKHLPM